MGATRGFWPRIARAEVVRGRAQGIWEQTRRKVNREAAYAGLVERASKDELLEQLQQYRWQTAVRFASGTSV